MKLSERNKNILYAAVSFIVLAACLLVLFFFTRNYIETGSFIPASGSAVELQMKDVDSSGKVNIDKYI